MVSGCLSHVPRAGIEPARTCVHWCLRPTRLPIPPSGHSGSGRKDTTNSPFSAPLHLYIKGGVAVPSSQAYPSPLVGQGCPLIAVAHEGKPKSYPQPIEHIQALRIEAEG